MKGEKGVTVMIGLLGPGKEMGKEADSLLEDDILRVSPCDLKTKLLTRATSKRLFLTAEYGPKAEDERMCGNCEYGNKLKGCGLRKKDEVFCEIFEFKCAKDQCLQCI
jgi:hypothetical protein